MVIEGMSSHENEIENSVREAVRGRRERKHINLQSPRSTPSFHRLAFFFFFPFFP